MKRFMIFTKKRFMSDTYEMNAFETEQEMAEFVVSGKAGNEKDFIACQRMFPTVTFGFIPTKAEPRIDNDELFPDDGIAAAPLDFLQEPKIPAGALNADDDDKPF